MSFLESACSETSRCQFQKCYPSQKKNVKHKVPKPGHDIPYIVPIEAGWSFFTLIKPYETLWRVYNTPLAEDISI